MLIARNQVISIRSFQESDAADFRNAVVESIDTVGVWLPWCHESYTESEALEWFGVCQENIDSNLAYDVGIFGTDSGDLLGSIAINNIDPANRIGSIGYWVRQSQQRKGIAVQAVQLICNFGQRNLGLNRLELVAVESNLASRRVAEKSGACFECIAQNRLVLFGKSMPAAVYSFTTKDN